MLYSEGLESINKLSLYGEPLGYKRYGIWRGVLPGELVTDGVTYE